jgi:hypothetical protein
MPTQFFITGFGEFHGVSRNPTQQIAEWLESKLQDRPTDSPGHATFTANGHPVSSSETRQQFLGMPADNIAATHPIFMPIVAAASAFPVVEASHGRYSPYHQQQQQQQLIQEQQQLRPFIRDVTVLQVSAEAVDAYMQDCMGKLAQCCSSAGAGPVVLLHFGVDTTVSAKWL